MKRYILLLGDLHVGSVSGIWPPGYRTKSGNKIVLNEIQEVLYRNFLKLCKKELVRKAETVILMGDLCQGNNRRRFGQETLPADLQDQVDAAVELLLPLCKAKRTYGVIGTGYHDSLDTHLDELVIRGLRGHCLGKLKILYIRETGHRILVTHGGKFGGVSIGTYADKVATSLLIGNARGKIPRIDIWAQGHLHQFWHHTTPAIDFVVAPCWQGWYYMDGIVANYGRIQPDIGAVVLELEKGKGPVVHRFLFDNVPIAQQGVLEEKI